MAPDPRATLASGTQLGVYRIESPIGAGGMGVVYRAMDTKLNRPVAVKFLSDALADPAARSRFQREAQMASSLNHPHIVTVHDVSEQVSKEGKAGFPAWGDGFPTSIFSPDGKKLYYLVQSGVQRGFNSGELWVSDLTADSAERLLPGITINSFDISTDGQRIVFSSPHSSGKPRIWLARLDRRSAPVQLAPAEALGPVFGSTGEVYFRAYESGQGYLYEIKLESGQIHKVIQDEAVNSPAISPDGQWIISWVPIAKGDATTIVKAYPTRGGDPVTICSSCFPKWSRDQRFLYLSLGFAADKTFVITLPSRQALPRLPESGVENEADVRKLPVVRVIDGNIFPGPSGSVYAFSRSFVQRNLYRMTLPQ